MILLHKTSGTSKSTEGERKLEVAKGAWGSEWRPTYNGLLWGDENGLKLRRSNGCITLNIPKLTV